MYPRDGIFGILTSFFSIMYFFKTITAFKTSYIKYNLYGADSASKLCDHHSTFIEERPYYVCLVVLIQRLGFAIGTRAGISQQSRRRDCDISASVPITDPSHYNGIFIIMARLGQDKNLSPLIFNKCMMGKQKNWQVTQSDFSMQYSYKCRSSATGGLYDV